MILFDSGTDTQTGTDVISLLEYCADLMKNVCVFHVSTYTFSLWDVMVTGTILILLGWMLGKFLNPWSYDHD